MREPCRAAASAASIHACPPPTTITSYTSSFLVDVSCVHGADEEHMLLLDLRLEFSPRNVRDVQPVSLCAQ